MRIVAVDTGSRSVYYRLIYGCNKCGKFFLPDQILYLAMRYLCPHCKRVVAYKEKI